MKRKRGQDHSVTFKRRRLRTEQPKFQSLFRVPNSVLDLHYDDVVTLRNFLRNCLPSASRIRRKRLTNFDSEYTDYAGYLDEVIIGISHTPSPDAQLTRCGELATFTQTQRVAKGNSGEGRLCDLTEIINFSIWLLFRKDIDASRTPSHLLCHGYQRAGSLKHVENDGEHVVLPGIVQRVCNSNAEYLKQPPWTHIANILGHDAERIMLHLFLDCGIFRRLASGFDNLYQLSGTSILSLSTRQKTQASGTAQVVARPPTSQIQETTAITFLRNRMLYARPSINKQGELQLGLKHIHILNRLTNLKNSEQDVRLMQYIFPYQFGLDNVFTLSTDVKRTKQVLRDYTLREQEIEIWKRGRKLKTPRRLRGTVLQLVQILRKNHSRCSISQLLRFYCPQGSPSCHISAPDLLRSLAPSSASEQLLTQLRKIDDDSLHSTPEISPFTTSFIPYATPTWSVVSFCQAVLTNLLPPYTFGTGNDGAHNWSKFHSDIEAFIRRPRFDPMTLNEVCSGQRIKCIGWLRPHLIHESSKMSKSDWAKRMQIFQEFMYYLFDSLLIPLIRSNFYVTETGIHRNRLFFFRHDTWKKMIEPSLGLMRLNMLAPLSAAQLRQHWTTNSLSCGQMRLLPKQHGTRPIMNLKRKASRIVGGKVITDMSINARLAPVFSVLNFERSQQPEISRSAMFSAKEIYARLGDFRADVLRRERTLYFVKVDIQSCFDSIPQQELLGFVKSLLSKSEYQISNHAEVKRVAGPTTFEAGRAVSKRVYRATDIGTDPLLSLQTATGLAKNKHRIVFSGLDHNRTMKLAQIHKLLSDHLQGHLIKIGRKHFRQVRGIPQGSVLSSLLCNLFYGDFEKQKLGFLKPKDSLLLRLIDDFLLITTDENQARHFLLEMSQGHSEHGISINADKSLVNFEISIAGHKVPRLHGGDEFPYCGMTINTQTLQIQTDRRMKDAHVSNGLSIVRSGRIGETLRNRIFSSLKRQMHAILINASLLPKADLLHGMYECYIDSGMKVYRYIKALDKAQQPSEDWLIKLYSQLIEVGIIRMRRSVCQISRNVSEHEIGWAASSALKQTIVRKQTSFSRLLSWLEETETANRHKTNLAKKELDIIVHRAMKGFANRIY